jgi:FAD/FMN-containing dehydrogenase
MLNITHIVVATLARGRYSAAGAIGLFLDQRGTRMNRRHLMTGIAAVPALAFLRPHLEAATAPGTPALPVSASRVRPGDPNWPSEKEWDRLREETGGRLSLVRSPWNGCREAPVGPECREFFRELKNPYYIGDDPTLTQTTGWVDAWTSQPSVFVVAAESASDVAAAINFARDHNLRLVVKGAGHSYLGSSTAPDSLMIWTRRMNAISMHDSFVAQGCEGRGPGQPAVSVGAGAVWSHTYNAVTTEGGRYVQGGSCISVGVAGLTLGGGFGSHSKAYGSAAASLLEAEVVTADGVVRVANACTHPDLFWALKGGGGGTFGVVTRLTLRTHPLPEFFGYVSTNIQAVSDVAFRRLIGRFLDFCAESLINPHWGEAVRLVRGRRLEINMAWQGLDNSQAEAIWQPFLRWVVEAGDDLSFLYPPSVRAIPARHRWDPAYLKAQTPGSVQSDNRPGASPENIFWTASLGEAGHYLRGMESVWLPASLLEPDQRSLLADALLEATRLSSAFLVFAKGLAGASAEVIAVESGTAVNPAVRDAFALALFVSDAPPAHPGLPGYAPDLAAARRDAAQIHKAMEAVRKVTPDPATYLYESNFFQVDWQRAYWGANYQRLMDVKRKYDPSGLFFTRHGVGSEDWSEDGFTRVVL